MDHDPLHETRPTGNNRARGLVSPRASGSRVQARRFAAPPDLADIVEALWVGTWDLTGQDPHTTELLGDPSVHLVFEDGPQATTGGRIVGVWTQLWVRTLADRGRVRALKLHPGAARALLNAPAQQWTNSQTPLGEPDLQRGVLGPDSDEEGLAALVDWARSRRRADPDVGLAVAIVDRARTRQIMRVDALADTAGLTVRSLQRLFRAHVGASPKWVLRRFRLQEVATRVEAGEVVQFADLALELGYADQAHLARDFRAATGRTLRGFERGVHAS